MQILKVENLNKNFGNLQVLSNINLDINEGEVLTIIGPSGAGKSTLIRTLNFFEEVESGVMTFKNETYDMNKITKKEIQKIRLRTSFVFQTFNLFENKNALENIMEGLVIVRKVDKKEAREISISLLDTVGLKNKMLNFPSELSGGEKQRVAIARAVATNPDIIYFDEPTSALDPEKTNEVIDVIKKLKEQKKTMLIVTHEMSFAKVIADRVIFLDTGHIIETGTKNEIFENPKNDRTKQFINKKYKEE